MNKARFVSQTADFIVFYTVYADGRIDVETTYAARGYHWVLFYKRNPLKPDYASLGLASPYESSLEEMNDNLQATESLAEGWVGAWSDGGDILLMAWDEGQQLGARVAGFGWSEGSGAHLGFGQYWGNDFHLKGATNHTIISITDVTPDWTLIWRGYRKLFKGGKLPPEASLVFGFLHLSKASPYIDEVFNVSCTINNLGEGEVLGVAVTISWTPNGLKLTKDVAERSIGRVGGEEPSFMEPKRDEGRKIQHHIRGFGG